MKHPTFKITITMNPQDIGTRAELDESIIDESPAKTITMLAAAHALLAQVLDTVQKHYANQGIMTNSEFQKALQQTSLEVMQHLPPTNPPS